MAVVGGLCHSSISRLKDTTSHVPSEVTKVIESSSVTLVGLARQPGPFLHFNFRNLAPPQFFFCRLVTRVGGAGGTELSESEPQNQETPEQANAK